jgi:hypothetical protein
LSPDGTLLFSDTGGFGYTAGGPSQLYSLPSTTVLPATGLPAGLQATLPAFSADGQHVTYIFWGGTGADQKSVAMMDFAVDGGADGGAVSYVFSNAQVLATPDAGAGSWPSFLPLNNGVVYEDELTASPYGFTWGGSLANLWWVDVATHTAAPLNNLNGVGYVPAGPAGSGHEDDTTLNYEPTVNPLVSGGYAWVVFTSRRMYGNVATINPTYSDPRSYPLLTNPDGGAPWITPKKLWVAAIDLSADAGTDPSHPAFYLPGQELYAGNSRGFWSLEPCRPDGQSCTSGDQCCGGYCEAAFDGGLACTTTKPPCAGLGDRCSVSGDCCGASSEGVVCVNGYCANLIE